MRRALMPAMMILVGLQSLAAAQSLPTQADIKKLYDDGKYPQVLSNIQRVLLLKGAAAKPYDRHELMLLKAETHLRLKATAPAIQAFESAANETSDAVSAATDLATALLFKRSKEMAYTPKAKGKAAIPIQEKDSRKQAIVALFEDELAADEPVLGAARQADKMPAIMNVLPMIRDLRVLELAATGKDAKCKELTGDLGKHARDLLAEGLKDLDPKLTPIEKTANESVPVDHVFRDPRFKEPVMRRETRYKKRGMETKEAQIVQSIYTTADKVAKACQDLSAAFGVESTDFNSIRTEAAKLANRAEALLKEDYSKTYQTPPGR